MYDSAAVLAEPGASTIAGEGRRIVFSGPGRSIARVSLPGLLDTRLVRAELVRLRGPRRPATAVHSGRSGGTRSRTGFDARRET
jgi:hypothetical protein